ncbi:DUF2867 domain-containing protein [Shinella curvata]|uniref:DUF2867 domain-containing protein n=1 Tax=Shinella curvata TaxID=1817964 RepID=A0ABT8XJP4_9HYPH|nr:DUF2867 domain-containing protein [Shinella curvata]MCJ8056249.1 DUF2867 domain-containing protein [Shinella curvata]MDO6123960.1 DUF2867 domain-containing protein [Shinella curvata]
MSPVSRPVSLPHPLLPAADWADRFTLGLPVEHLTAREAARLALENPPGWVRRLMVLRNAIVAPFGLKGAAEEVKTSETEIGGFPVVSATDERVVLGFDDRHLDFRIVIDVMADRLSGQTLSVMTLVHRNNLLGRLYLAAVMPFHKLIVRTMLSGIGRRAIKLSSPR